MEFSLESSRSHCRVSGGGVLWDQIHSSESAFWVLGASGLRSGLWVWRPEDSEEDVATIQERGDIPTNV